MCWWLGWLVDVVVCGFCCVVFLVGSWLVMWLGCYCVVLLGLGLGLGIVLGRLGDVVVRW